MPREPLLSLRRAPWVKERQHDAKTLWDWYDALFEAASASVLEPAFVHTQASRLLAGDSVTLVPASVWRATHALFVRERWSMDILARQVRAVSACSGTVRFRTRDDLRAFLVDWAGGQARMIGFLGGIKGGWQGAYLDDLAMGFFLTKRLLALREDLNRNRLYVPLADLEAFQANVEKLREGVVDDAMRKVLWRQVVRARDALAQGAPLLKEVDRAVARGLRAVWLESMELLLEMERRRFDLWSAPVRLARRHRFVIGWRTYITRSVAHRLR